MNMFLHLWLLIAMTTMVLGELSYKNWGLQQKRYSLGKKDGYKVQDGYGHELHKDYGHDSYDYGLRKDYGHDSYDYGLHKDYSHDGYGLSPTGYGKAFGHFPFGKGYDYTYGKGYGFPFGKGYGHPYGHGYYGYNDYGYGDEYDYGYDGYGHGYNDFGYGGYEPYYGPNSKFYPNLFGANRRLRFGYY